MIAGVTVEGFRGLRRLTVDGFGKVNLIIGRNNCGKTALLEALMIAEGAEAASHSALFVQRRRRSGVPIQDFDRFWRPLFWNQDADQGFSIEVHGSKRDPLRVAFQKAASPSMMLTEQAVDAASAPAAWAMNVRITNGDERAGRIEGGAAGLRLPPAPASGGPWWVGPSKSVGPEEIRLFSKLKQSGREAELREVLREVDGRVSGIEILALTGTEAELFVRLEPASPLLPIAMMGDGFQRCFEIGVAAVTWEWPFLFIDELDNGLHHSVLEPLFRWLGVISAKRDLQVFATTHSEECIHAACRAFTALSDDGLRVIRLDRREDRTTAAVYDRALVETAAETGAERITAH